MKKQIERWQKVFALFDRVVDLGADERMRILAAECADQADLRGEIERLLHADRLESPLDHYIAGRASLMLIEDGSERRSQAAVAVLGFALADAERYLPARHPEVTHLREQLAHAYLREQDYASAVALLQCLLKDAAAVRGQG